MPFISASNALPSSSPLTLKVVLTSAESLPQRQRESDVGFDLTACSVRASNRDETEVKSFLVQFGVRVEPPKGYYLELIPRSSLAWTGFIMPNGLGVIDPNYRGDLMMPLIYLGDPLKADERASSLVGRRLAQMVVRAVYTPYVEQVALEELSQTERGEAAFGSSGH